MSARKDFTDPASALLTVENVSKTFGGGRWLLGRPRAEVRAVDGVSFELRTVKRSASSARQGAARVRSVGWYSG